MKKSSSSQFSKPKITATASRTKSSINRPPSGQMPKQSSRIQQNGRLRAPSGRPPIQSSNPGGGSEFENQGHILAGETQSHYRKVFKPTVSQSNNYLGRMPPHGQLADNDNGGDFNLHNQQQQYTPSRDKGYGHSQIPTGTSSSINSSQFSVQHKKPFQSSQTKLKANRQQNSASRAMQ